MSSSSSSPAPPHVVEDCLGIVQLLSDGTVTRSGDYSSISLMRDVPIDLPVQWKDVVYDAGRGLRLRMYAPANHGGEEGKLPVLVYFHGGGFCIASFELPNFHAGALRLAGELPAVVLSADYRLAPRAPPPRPRTRTPWPSSRGSAARPPPPPTRGSPRRPDFERVFVCGDSCGGNIAHHLTVGCGSGDIALDAARLAGCVMLWPYFGGEERMPSEAPPPPPEGDASPSAMGITLFDQMWRLSLPAGATRDHPAANPFGPDSPAARRRRVPAGAHRGPRAGRAPRPRRRLRGEAAGHGEARRARQVRRAGPWLLRARPHERGLRRARPRRQALRARRLGDRPK
ncbi:hypothetical protein OsJ_23185 [Oryza sativa Japonica Group]|uniref:Alpha/beta hydrolase fold-3 domain-containing protein n=1 Tax=Oryza sativa subsp. japonica TaxID=39947 RepID=A3BGU3_ORYSJ|nr:hypothetical protein OsJ_23185 [Oryza sativa Japonica Group]